jgi:predicted type IV restriction endonuclease
MTKTVEEAAKVIKTFLPILQGAKDRKINEADTRTIIHKFLADVLGYDFIADITKEFTIRGTFADFGVMIDNEVKYIVEAKEIGTKLQEGHIRQAVGYAVNKGVPWCVLTDSAVWRLYRIEFKQPVETVQVFDIDLL